MALGTENKLLEMRGITKDFVQQPGMWGTSASFVRAVAGVDFSIYSGKNVSIVGESGCGKTTLARIIARLVTLTKGSISCEGRDVTTARAAALLGYRRSVQMVFQDPSSSLDPRFTVRNSIAEAFYLLGAAARSAGEREKRICEVLAAVHLDADMAERYPHELSGGERQRVAIARALIAKPKLLILDEAVSSLDVIIQAQIIDLLIELQKSYPITYLFISHNLRVVRRISSVIAVMYNGRIVESAPTEELFASPLHPYTRQLLSAAFEYAVTTADDEPMVTASGILVERSPAHFVLDPSGNV